MTKRKTTNNRVYSPRGINYKKGKATKKGWRYNQYIKPSSAIGYEPKFTPFTELDEEHQNEILRNRAMRTSYINMIVAGDMNTGLSKFKEKEQEPEYNVVLPVFDDWETRKMKMQLKIEAQKAAEKAKAFIEKAKGKPILTTPNEKIRAKIKKFGE